MGRLRVSASLFDEMKEAECHQHVTCLFAATSRRASRPIANGCGFLHRPHLRLSERPRQTPGRFCRPQRNIFRPAERVRGSLGESRLAPFFRDGLEVDPQDVVGREVNPRIPVAALIGPNNRKNVERAVAHRQVSRDGQIPIVALRRGPSCDCRRCQWRRARAQPFHQLGRYLRLVDRDDGEQPRLADAADADRGRPKGAGRNPIVSLRHPSREHRCVARTPAREAHRSPRHGTVDPRLPRGCAARSAIAAWWRRASLH